MGTLEEMTGAWAGVVVIRVAEADLVVEAAPDVVEKLSNPLAMNKRKLARFHATIAFVRTGMGGISVSSTNPEPAKMVWTAFVEKVRG